MRYSFTDKAENDLEGIVDFTLNKWGRLQAAKYLSGFEKTAQTLAENPSIGIQRNAILSGLFSFPHERHIIYFTHRENEIVIIRVLHSSMDPHSHQLNDPLS